MVFALQRGERSSLGVGIVCPQVRGHGGDQHERMGVAVGRQHPQQHRVRRRRSSGVASELMNDTYGQLVGSPGVRTVPLLTFHEGWNRSGSTPNGTTWMRSGGYP